MTEQRSDRSQTVDGSPRPSGEPRYASTRFAATSSSVADARHFVAGVLDAWSLPAQAAVPPLRVSEPAPTAFVPPRPAFAIIVTAGDSPTVRIAVRDGDLGLPRLGIPQPDDETGRGLRVVETLASDWG